MKPMTVEQARIFIAELISQGYDCYLPIFERLDAEYEKIQAQQTLLDKARALAQKNPTLESHSAF